MLICFTMSIQDTEERRGETEGAADDRDSTEGSPLTCHSGSRRFVRENPTTDVHQEGKSARLIKISVNSQVIGP